MAKSSGREKARECLMLLLYQMDIQNDYSDLIKERYLEEYKKEDFQKEYLNCIKSNCEKFDSKYFNNLLNTIRENINKIDSILSEASNNWKLDRIAKVDLAILRISTAELLYFEDIPVGASINEAVKMAKRFSSEESGKFVNGILGKINKDKS